MKYSGGFILLNLLVFLSLFAEKPESIQYISPQDKSVLNSRASHIIIRPGGRIDQASVTSDLVEVIGEMSGYHNGDIVLSTDGRTIIFKPKIGFDPGENVRVILKNGLKLDDGEGVLPFEFSFKVTPLIQPLNIFDFKEELNIMRLPVETADQSLVVPASSDTLPQDFPTFTVVVNDTPATGDFFFSPTRIVSGDGYNVIVTNSGDIKYYDKITEGVPFDFKVLPNAMLSFGILSEFYEFGGGGDTDFYMMDSSYSIVNHYTMGNGYTADFHEFQYLPNGHVFMVAYDLQPIDMSEIVEGGHPGALVAGSVIQELDLDMNVIFQWRSWDHYDLLDSYADLTQSIFDAIHINSIELDESDNNIIISTLALAEATKINRQTGEIIWRMGGKNNQFTFIDESNEHAPLYFMFQHEIRRLENGNITLFDGGDKERRAYSRAVEYEIDESNKTARKVWEYRKNPDIYSPNMGCVQRLDNGNTVIGWGLASMYGDPAITEVDPDGNIVFELTFDQPLTTSYRAMKFDWDGGSPAAEVTVSEVNPGNTYSFDSGDQYTGVSINVIAHSGFGYNEINVKRYAYSPLSPVFVGKAPIVEQSRIVTEQYFIDLPSFEANIMFDVDFFKIEKPDSVNIYYRQFEGSGLFIALPTDFNPATNKIVTTMNGFGEFVIAYPDHKSQIFPPLPVYPKESQLVDQTGSVRLEWTPVGYAKEFSLEIARDSDFNQIVVNEQSMKDAIYDFISVDTNTVYYWHVKAFDDNSESPWCQTYTFETTKPYVELLTPEPGTQWRRGLEYFITWEDILKEDVILELLRSDSLKMVIDTTASTGGYKWNIPLHVDVADNYKILIRSVEKPDISDISDGFFKITDDAPQEPSPDVNALSQNYPNPFNPSIENTEIRYVIRETGHVLLKIYNTLGSEVSTLVDRQQVADTYSVDFNGSNLSSGLYFYMLYFKGKLIDSKKMLLIK